MCGIVATSNHTRAGQLKAGNYLLFPVQISAENETAESDVLNAPLALSGDAKLETKVKLILIAQFSQVGVEWRRPNKRAVKWLFN